MKEIPFNRPYMTGDELELIRQAHASAHLSSGGQFSRKCETWLKEKLGCARAILTHSCTDALEIAAILADIQPGDEVILPSFTFVTTASAFVLRGGVPVFVDIDAQSLNIDLAAIEAAITPRTKAIVPVHYAGVGCEMDGILSFARDRRLMVIEDAAHALGSTWRGRPLGSIGAMGTLSFHETKNVISGEGGALIVNDPALAERAGIVAQKGTNRELFLAGKVPQYTWVDLGSSFMPSELVAAFLWAQLQKESEITAKRRSIWERYNDAFSNLEKSGRVRRPYIPPDDRHNAHLYYLLVDPQRHARILKSLRQKGIDAHFHYVPLHSSPAGKKYGRVSGSMKNTDYASGAMLRLPLWIGLSEADQDRVISAVGSSLD